MSGDDDDHAQRRVECRQRGTSVLLTYAIGVPDMQPRTPDGRKCCAGNAVLQVGDGWRNADAAVCQHWRPGCSAPTDTVVRGRSDTGELSLLA